VFSHEIARWLGWGRAWLGAVCGVVGSLEASRPLAGSAALLPPTQRSSSRAAAVLDTWICCAASFNAEIQLQGSCSSRHLNTTLHATSAAQPASTGAHFHWMLHWGVKGFSGSQLPSAGSAALLCEHAQDHSSRAAASPDI
jgi:hypothetical protein